MQTTKWELYEYQRSRSVIDLGPNHLHSIFLNFFSSITADFNTSSAIRWAIQDQWSSGLIELKSFYLVCYVCIWEPDSQLISYFECDFWILNIFFHFRPRLVFAPFFAVRIGIQKSRYLRKSGISANANMKVKERQQSKERRKREKIQLTISFLYPATQKWRGIMLYCSNFECPSVCPSVLRFHALTLVCFDRFSSNFA